MISGCERTGAGPAEGTTGALTTTSPPSVTTGLSRSNPVVSTRCTFPRCHWHWQGTEAEGAAQFSTHRRMAHLYAGFYAYSTTAPMPAPLPKRIRMMRVTNTEILGRLRDEAATVEGPLSIQAWTDSRRRPGASSIINRFGSWNAALTAAGLEVRSIGGKPSDAVPNLTTPPGPVARDRA